jgi:hypothetical protein
LEATARWCKTNSKLHIIFTYFLAIPVDNGYFGRSTSIAVIEEGFNSSTDLCLCAFIIGYAGVFAIANLLPFHNRLETGRFSFLWTLAVILSR